MVCCPHLNIYVKQLVQKQTLEVPIYILPPKMYGMMEIKEIYQDALDIIKIFNEKPKFVSVLSGKINTVYDLDSIL
ncbi:MAG: PTS sugar transporter subunit IIB, partial [Niameybacter sp.]